MQALNPAPTHPQRQRVIVQGVHHHQGGVGYALFATATDHGVGENAAIAGTPTRRRYTHGGTISQQRVS